MIKLKKLAHKHKQACLRTPLKAEINENKRKYKPTTYM